MQDRVAKSAITAYHSSHMTTIGMKYQRALDEASCSISRPSNPFLHDMFSTVSGGLLATEDLSSGYWIRNLCSPVNFAGAMVAATKVYPSIVLLELGPHPALKCPTLETLDQHCGQERRYFHSCHRGHSSFRSMLGSAVEMMESGINIDSSQLNGLSDALSTHLTPENHPVLTNLPSYPWDHSQSHWGESRASRDLRFRAFPRHPLLGSRAFGDNPNQMFWRNHPGIDDFPMPEAGESVSYISGPYSPQLINIMYSGRNLMYHSCGLLHTYDCGGFAPTASLISVANLRCTYH